MTQPNKTVDRSERCTNAMGVKDGTVHLDYSIVKER
jgi:hypothetical protein